MTRRRVTTTQKVRTTVYFDPDASATLEALAARWHMPLTRVVEDLVDRGLAQVSGEQVEREALPAVRAVVEEVLRAELVTMAKRLTGITQKGVREAAIGTSLVRALVTGLDPDHVTQLVAEAERNAGRLLAEREPVQE